MSTIQASKLAIITVTVSMRHRVLRLIEVGIGNEETKAWTQLQAPTELRCGGANGRAKSTAVVTDTPARSSLSEYYLSLSRCWGPWATLAS